MQQGGVRCSLHHVSKKLGCAWPPWPRQPQPPPGGTPLVPPVLGPGESESVISGIRFSIPWMPWAGRGGLPMTWPGGLPQPHEWLLTYALSCAIG